MKHGFRSPWPRMLIAATAVAAAVALSAGWALATTNAKGESAHLSLGIVGKDVVSSGKTRGVRVIEVFGPRAGRSLKPGDVVMRVDGVRIRNGNDLEEALQFSTGAPSVEILRDGRVIEIQVPRLEDRLGWIGNMDGDARHEIRRIVRDVQRDIQRDVRRDVQRIRVVDRDNIREAVRRVVDELRELGLRFEDEGWI